MNQDRERRDTENDKALIKVLLTRKKGKRIINFNAADFFKEVVTHGWPFLDVAIVNVPNGESHGMSTHLIQDLVVDKALQKIGWSAAGSGNRSRKHLGVAVRPASPVGRQG